MSSQSVQTAISKDYEYCSVYESLPDVLVQDPIRSCAYYIEATDLMKFQTSASVWTQINPGTVTFVIPDGDMLEELPPFSQSSELELSILLRYVRGQSSYFLSYEDLQKFRIPQPTETPDTYHISFIVPVGTDLIEELPPLRKALLQSNQGGSSGLPPMRKKKN